MSHQSKKLVLLFLSTALLVSGCSQKKELPVKQADSGLRMLQADPMQVSTVEAASATTTKTLKLSPLEYAQKEYLDSYNDYVRLLRESGPQTIDTLQALALYQKKYQIYQMLLKAEGATGQ